MALIVGRRPVLEPQIVWIDRPTGERDLIIVRVIERFRQSVGSPQLIVVRETLFGAHKQAIIFRLDA